MTYANGDSYVGPFSLGQKNGGVFIKKNGEKYEGAWLEEKYHGYGKLTYED